MPPDAAIDIALRMVDQATAPMQQALQRVEKSSAATERQLQRLNLTTNDLWKQFAGGYAVADLAVRTVERAYRAVRSEIEKGLGAVEDYNMKVASMTAFMTTFAKKTREGNLAEAFQEANQYAQALIPKLEIMDAKTVATGQELSTMAETMMMHGVILDVNNARQERGFLNIANALKLVTAGQDQDKQIRQEVNALMEGQVRMTDRLPKLLEAIDPQLQDHLQLWKEQGTTVENVGRLLEGFGASTALIENTWAAIGSSLETIHNRVLRGGMQSAYQDLLNLALSVRDAFVDQNGHLTAMGQLVQGTIAAGWENVKNTLSIVWNLLRPFTPLFSLLADLTAAIADGWGMLLAFLEPVFKRIGSFFDALMDNFRAAGMWIEGIWRALSFDFKGSKEAMAQAENLWLQGGVDLGKAFSGGFVAEVDANLARYFAANNKAKPVIPAVPPVLGLATQTGKDAAAATKELARLEDVLQRITLEVMPEHEQAVEKIKRQYWELRDALPALVQANRLTFEEAAKLDELLDARAREALAGLEQKKWQESRRAVREYNAEVGRAYREVTKELVPEYQRGLDEIGEKYDELRWQAVYALQDMIASVDPAIAEEGFRKLEEWLATFDVREREALEKYRRANDAAAAQIEKIWDGAYDRMTEGLADWIRSGEFELDDFVDYFKDALSQMVAAWIMSQAKMTFGLGGTAGATAGTVGGALGTFTGTGTLGSTIAGIGNLGLGALGSGLSVASATWDFLSGTTYSAVAAANAAAGGYNAYGAGLSAASEVGGYNAYGASLLPATGTGGYEAYGATLQASTSNAVGSLEAFSTGLEAATAKMQIVTATFLKETLGMESAAASVLNMSQAQFSGVLQGGVEFLSYGISTGDWEEATARGVTQGLTTWGLMSIPYVGPILVLADAIGGGFIVDTVWDAFGWSDPKPPRVMSYGQMQYDSEAGGFAPITQDSGDIRDTWSRYAGSTAAPHSGYKAYVNKAIEQINPRIESALDAIPDALEDRVREYFAAKKIDITFHQKSFDAINNWAKMFSEQVNEALLDAYSQAIQDQMISSFLVSPIAAHLNDPAKVTGALQTIDSSDLSAEEKMSAMSAVVATVDQFVSSFTALRGEVVDFVEPLLQLYGGLVKNTEVARELGVSLDLVNDVYQKQIDLILGSNPQQIAAGIVSIAEGIERFESGIARAQAAGFGDLADDYADSLDYLNGTLIYAFDRMAAQLDQVQIDDAARQLVTAVTSLGEARNLIESMARQDVAATSFHNGSGYSTADELGVADSVYGGMRDYIGATGNVAGYDYYQGGANNSQYEAAHEIAALLAVEKQFDDALGTLFSSVDEILHPMSELEKGLAGVNTWYERQIAILNEVRDVLSVDQYSGWLADINAAAELQARDLIANYIDPVTAAWKAGIDSLMFSDLAPVQSMEMYTGRYNELLAGAQSGDSQAVSDIFSFLKSDFLPFAQANMGAGYNDMWASVMGDLNGIPQALPFDPDSFQLPTPSAIGSLADPGSTASAANSFQPIIDAINSLAERPVEATVNSTVNLDSQVVATNTVKTVAVSPPLARTLGRAITAAIARPVDTSGAV